MKHITERQKRWHAAKMRAVMRRRVRINRGRIKKLDQPHNYSRLEHRTNRVVLSAPAHLSLISNKEETLSFFEESIRATKECRTRQTIYFDLENVETITPDAIMYLIALVNNVKRVRTLRITCEGNLPRSKEAREMIEKAGFYQHVNSLRVSRTFDKGNRIQISSGNNVNGPFIGSICDFVQAHSAGHGSIQTKRLYRMFTELMTNTYQHAYKDSGSVMDDHWFIYVENSEEYIYFVFLDTGVGIPATIRLNIKEKVEKLFLKNNDAKYISSALKGDFRTETRQGHRGKGLPGIYSDTQSGDLYDLTIISGKGACYINSKCEMIESSSSVPFCGTLFCWKYSKLREVA